MPLFVLSLFSFLTTAIIANAQQRIDIRAHTVLPSTVQEALFSVTVPTQLRIPANLDVDSWLRNWCGGAVSNTYLAKFTDLNRSRENPVPRRAENFVRTVHVPACPRILRDRATVQVLPTDVTADDLFRRAMGVSISAQLYIFPNEINEQSESCPLTSALEWFRRRHPAIDPNDIQRGLRSGTFLDMPYRSIWTTVTLKNDATADSARTTIMAAVARINGSPSVIDVVNSGQYELLSPADATSSLELNDPSCSPVTQSNAPPWPYDRAATAAAIVASRAMLRRLEQQGVAQRQATVIRIADTGLDPAIPPGSSLEPFLARNVDALQRLEGLPRSARSMFRFPVYGFGPENTGDIRPTSNDETRNHGLIVADLALGGNSLREQLLQLNVDLRSDLRITIARIFDTSTHGSNISSSSSIVNSIISRSPIANIVNMSIGGTSDVQTLRQAFQGLVDRGQMVVLSAGNKSMNLSNTVFYPVSYRNDAPHHVVVVGSHGPLSMDEQGYLTGSLSSFSNRSNKYVDILAPGCRLPSSFSNDSTNDFDLLAGTSFAAPLATFSIALLHRYLSSEPRQIRMRLFATTRWISKEAEEETAFGGALDIPASLRIFDDLIRRPNGSLEIGRWDMNETIQLCQGNPIDNELLSRNILRVWIMRPGTGRDNLALRISRRLDNDEIYTGPECTPNSDFAPSLQINGGSLRLKWSDIAAFIPAAQRFDDLENVFRRNTPVAVSASTSAVSTRVPSEITNYINSIIRTDTPLAPRSRELAVSAAIREFQRNLGERPTGSLTPSQSRVLSRSPLEEISRFVPENLRGNLATR